MRSFNIKSGNSDNIFLKGSQLLKVSPTLEFVSRVWVLRHDTDEEIQKTATSLWNEKYFFPKCLTFFENNSFRHLVFGNEHRPLLVDLVEHDNENLQGAVCRSIFVKKNFYFLIGIYLFIYFLIG